jgi:cytochrome oxidase Cu insertion factor (SCO1/SenC/PrrC family)
VGARALRLAVITFVGIVAGVSPSRAQPDPFVSLQALRVTPPDPAPDVSFRTLDGRPVSLAMLRGRPVLLTFFTTW